MNFKIEFLFAWQDLWIGFFWDKKKKWLYIIPFPTVGVILKFRNTPAVSLEEQIKIQTELLELAIKSGRRLMHDYKHLLSELPPDSMFKKEFAARGQMWEDIFYPDKGFKNYRTQLHEEINWLSVKLKVAQDRLKEHGLEPDPDSPF